MPTQFRRPVEIQLNGSIARLTETIIQLFDYDVKLCFLQMFPRSCYRNVFFVEPSFDVYEFRCLRTETVDLQAPK